MTAYLTKQPEHGYPAWVTGSRVGSVRRYEASRGFWTAEAEQADDDQPAAQDAGGCNEADTVLADEAEVEDGRRSIAEQVAECGRRCVALVARDVVNPATGEVEVRRSFLAAIPAELAEVVRHGPQPDELNRRATVAVYRDPAALVAALAAVVPIPPDNPLARWYIGSQ